MVRTTPDPQQPTSSSPFTVSPTGKVSGITVDNSFPTRAAGGRTNYTVAFALSDRGRLAETANSHITIDFPDTTGFGGLLSGDATVIDVEAQKDVGYCGSANAQGQITCSLDSNASIPAGHRVEIRLYGITNPTTATDKLQLSVDTTS